jgi:hypothetical protein
MGKPMAMLKGNEIPNAIGIYSPGSALGAAKRMAAGTTTHEALAAGIAKTNLSPTSRMNSPLNAATLQPFIIGTMTADAAANHPSFINAEDLLAATIPISQTKVTRKPLKISPVDGLIPSAHFALENAKSVRRYYGGNCKSEEQRINYFCSETTVR